MNTIKDVINNNQQGHAVNVINHLILTTQISLNEIKETCH